MTATTTSRATWRIVPYEVPARDAWNATGLDLCPQCRRYRYAANDAVRLVDAEGRELCPWACAENSRTSRFDTSEAMTTLHAVVASGRATGVCSQLEKLVRRQYELDRAPELEARAEAWREEVRAKHEEAVRRQAELDALEPGERARRARELAW